MAAYKAWHEFLPHVRRDARYTLGIKIDNLLIETTDQLYGGHYASKGEKLPYIERAARHLDLAKFFLEILWEIKAFDGENISSFQNNFTRLGK